jgi:hypothetical protein
MSQKTLGQCRRAPFRLIPTPEIIDRHVPNSAISRLSASPTPSNDPRLPNVHAGRPRNLHQYSHSLHYGLMTVLGGSYHFISTNRQAIIQSSGKSPTSTICRSSIHAAWYQQGFETFCQEFESTYCNGGLWISIVHPFATGRMPRWKLWETVLEEVSAHVENVTADGTYRPRRDSLPYFSGLVSLILPV